jgi:hypothetical protein
MNTRLPTLCHYSGSNAISVTIGELRVFFSYETPVAFRHQNDLVVRENDWCYMREDHLTTIDGGSEEAIAQRVGAEAFEAALLAVTKGGGA